MRWVPGALVGALLAAPVSGLPPPVRTAAGFDQTLEGLRGDQCGKHLARARAIASGPEFAAGRPKRAQVDFLWNTSNCAYKLSKYDDAFEFADRATKLDPDIEWLQVVRLYFGYQHERPDASLDALQVLSRLAPDRVRDLDLATVGDLLRAAAKLDPDGDRSLAVYAALARAKYVPAPPNHDDFLRMGHGKWLLRQGRVEDARRVLQGIVDVDSVIEMRVDRRFDPLRGDPAFAAQLDVAAAVRKDVARSRAAMQANPQSLESVYLHASVLHGVLRDAEGLAVVDEALARDAADPAAFADAQEYRNWVVNLRGYFLYGLGRRDEGRAALVMAAGLAERGEPNVSNIINLGGFLVDEGRAAEAVALIPRIGEASPYGQGWIEAIRACAGVQLKDEKMRTAGLAHLKAHEADNPGAYSRALLCSNDLDGAAALMIRRLEDGEQRVDALLALQVMPDAGQHDLPFARTLRVRRAALRDRADVRAAVDKVGRIERFPGITARRD